MINKYAGDCKCGAKVAAGAGTVTKTGGKWQVVCAECGQTAKAEPELAHDDAIYWPNGLGYTCCSAAYASAHDDLLAARRDYEDAGGEDTTDAAAYERYHRASHRVDQMLGAGGHLGERVETPYDPMMALLGGGTIGVSPASQGSK